LFENIDSNYLNCHSLFFAKGNEPEKMEEEDDDLDLLSDDDIAKLADTSLAVTRKKTG